MSCVAFKPKFQTSNDVLREVEALDVVTMAGTLLTVMFVCGTNPGLET